jgi:WD40 repeat protein
MSSPAQGYAIEIAFDERARQLHDAEIARGYYAVQDGWRFWFARVSLENSSNSGSGCIYFVDQDKYRNRVVKAEMVDSGGYLREAVFFLKPDVYGFQAQLCPNTALVGYVYGEIPRNQTPASVTLPTRDGTGFKLDLTKTSVVTPPLLDVTQAPSKEFVWDSQEFSVRVYPVTPRMDNGRDRLVFHVELENKGGYNLEDAVKIVAIDNHGRFFGNSTDAPRIVPGSKQAFEITSYIAAPTNPQLEVSKSNITRIFAMVLLKQNPQQDSYYNSGSLYYDAARDGSFTSSSAVATAQTSTQNLSNLQPISRATISNLNLIGEIKVSSDRAIFSADGSQLAVYAGEQLEVWDVATGELKFTLDHSDEIGAYMFSPTDHILATITNIHQVTRLWDTDTGKMIAEFNDAWYGLAFSPDGAAFAYGIHQYNGTYTNGFGLWDVKNRKAKPGVSLQTETLYMPRTFSPDGKFLYTDNGYSRITVWDTTKLTEVGVLTCDNEWKDSQVYYPAGAASITVYNENGILCLFDPNTFERQARLDVSDADTGIAISAQYIAYVMYTGDAKYALHVMDTKTRRDVLVTSPFEYYLMRMRFAGVNQELLSISIDDVVYGAGERTEFWSVESGKKLHEIKTFISTISPDGMRLLSNEGKYWGVLR